MCYLWFWYQGDIGLISSKVFLLQFLGNSSRTDVNCSLNVWANLPVNPFEPGPLFGRLLRIYSHGASLVVPWLRLHVSHAGAQVRLLVGELRSHIPHSMAKNVLNFLTVNWSPHSYSFFLEVWKFFPSVLEVHTLEVINVFQVVHLSELRELVDREAWRAVIHGVAESDTTE